MKNTNYSLDLFEKCFCEDSRTHFGRLCNYNNNGVCSLSSLWAKTHSYCCINDGASTRYHRRLQHLSLWWLIGSRNHSSRYSSLLSNSAQPGASGTLSFIRRQHAELWLAAPLCCHVLVWLGMGKQGGEWNPSDIKYISSWQRRLVYRCTVDSGRMWVSGLTTFCHF